MKINRQEFRWVAAMTAVAAALFVLVALHYLPAELSMLAMSRGMRPPFAKAAIEKRLQREPQDLRANGWMLLLSAEEGDFNDAERRISYLALRDPDSYLTNYAGCRYFLLRNDRFNALTYCGKALALSERGVEDLIDLSAALILNGQYHEAVAILEEALAKDPDNIKALNNMGYAFTMMEDFEKSAEWLNRAIEKDPKNQTAWKNLARNFYEAEQYRKSADVMSEYITHYPRDTEMIENLVKIHLELFEFGQAKLYVDMYYDVTKDAPKARKLLMMVDDEQRKYNLQ